MNEQGARILADLAFVDGLRSSQRARPALAAAVTAIKRFQQARFALSYADLLASPRYQGAARFFLDELYGPGDFAQRDAQFARVVPALVRIFPADVVETVVTLGQLHALSERLDQAMAEILLAEASPRVDRQTYLVAWRRVGQNADRQLQIDLTIAVGGQLDHFTRSKLLRHSLRLMRGPARAAGLEQLQRFLETGFDTFAAMGGAAPFLRVVRQREEALAADLFGGRAEALPAELGDHVAGATGRY